MICGVCYEQEIEVSLGASECYCERCLLSWVKECIEQNMANLNTITVPALVDPDHQYPLHHILGVLSPTACAEIQALLLKRYLMHTDNLLECPSCGYHGFISDTQQDCKFPFQCQKCCAQWVPKSYESYQKKCFLIKFCDQTMTNLNKVVTGQPCPFCQAIIYKDGGCPYVQCTKCRTQFCWLCLKDYHFHLAQIRFCPQRLISLAAIYILLLVAVFFKWSMCSPLLYYLESWIISTVVTAFSLLGDAFLSFGYFASYPFTILVLNNVFKFCTNLYLNCRHRGRPMHKITCFLFTCTLWLCFQLLLHKLYEYYQTSHLLFAIYVNYLLVPVHLARRIFQRLKQCYRMRRLKRRL